MIHRRSLLAAAASAPLAGLAGSFAQATPVDPHPVWMEQWKEVRTRWTDTVESSAEDLALSAEKDRLASLIKGADAHTAKGLLAQIECMQGQIYDGLFVETEDHPFLLRILQSARNLAA